MGISWEHLGASRAVLGGLGAALGRSCGDLGRSWDGLRAVLGGLGAVFGFTRVWRPTLQGFGGPPTPARLPATERPEAVEGGRGEA